MVREMGPINQGRIVVRSADEMPGSPLPLAPVMRRLDLHSFDVLVRADSFTVQRGRRQVRDDGCQAIEMPHAARFELAHRLTR